MNASYLAPVAGIVQGSATCATGFFVDFSAAVDQHHHHLVVVVVLVLVVLVVK